MTKRTCQIICSWILLLSFITGQYMVYAHQHNINKNAHSMANHGPKCKTTPTFTEKCQVCDSMHHISMDLANQTTYNTIAGTDFVFKTFKYEFTSLALILTPGRAPPVVS